jgi:hypothetical protein
MNENQTSYSASFAAGGLLWKETSCLLPILLAEQPENQIRDALRTEIINNNLLKINSETSRKRIVAEIIKRFVGVNGGFRQFYTENCEQEQKLLLFYLCLKTYKLMFDFHFNVTLKRWNSSSRQIDPYFYKMELDEIAVRDKRVDSWSDLTKQKLIEVYLRILRETGVCEANDNRLSPAEAPNTFWRYFVNNQACWFLDACLLSVRQKQIILSGNEYNR